MENNPIQFISLLVTIAALFGWLMKQVISYFINSNNEKSSYIEKLVAANQTNTENFVNAINHQQTMNREAQSKTTQAMVDIKTELVNTNNVNKQMLEFFQSQIKK